jgi:molybdopterin molybdotransferase
MTAVLKEDISKKTGLTYFVRCRFFHERGVLYSTTTGEQGSGILSSMVKAHGFIVLPAEKTLVRAGEEVRVMSLDPYLFYTSKPTYLPE